MDIRETIFSLIASRTPDAISVNADTQLIGDGRVLNSMSLVEICLELEDLAGKHDFNFDWTSDTAMSRSRSMFRTAGSLADTFIEQMGNKT